jgi:hypothetical protein
VKRQWPWLAAIVGLVAVGALVTGGGGTAGASALALGPNGWRGAALWVERQGGEVVLLDRSLDEALPDLDPAVLVAAFPAHGWYPPQEMEALDGFVEAGGVLILGVSGGAPSTGEVQLANQFGVDFEPGDDRAPLTPWGWLDWARGWEPLEPAEEWSGRALTAPRMWLRAVPSQKATVLFRWADGEPAVWLAPWGDGRVLVLPSAVFSNAGLGRAANADLLLSLIRGVPGNWLFDEVRHGLVDPTAPGAEGNLRVFDGLILHLLVIYGLIVLALARRFGPPWPTLATPESSTTAFLLSMGRLHRRLGHHRDAARLLVKRARRLDPSIDLADPEREVSSDADLVNLARACHRSKELS